MSDIFLFLSRPGSSFSLNFPLFLSLGPLGQAIERKDKEKEKKTRIHKININEDKEDWLKAEKNREEVVEHKLICLTENWQNDIAEDISFKVYCVGSWNTSCIICQLPTGTHINHLRQ